MKPKHIFLLSGLFCFSLFYAVSSFGGGTLGNPLKDVNKLLSQVNYKFIGESDIEVGSYVREHDFFPERVTKHIYWLQSGSPGKIDYYTFGDSEKYIGTDIYIYDKKGLKYVVFLNNTGAIQMFKKIIPIHSVQQDYAKDVELFEEAYNLL